MLLVEDIRIKDVDGLENVDNFQVEDFHTYYVCELGVLVHNAGNGYKNVPVQERTKADNGLDYQ